MQTGEALYNDAQANEILRTAVRLAAPDEITFEELVTAAAELGISRAELHEAEERYRENSSEAGLRQDFRNMQRLELRAFALHAAMYAVVAEIIVFVELRHLRVIWMPLVLAAWISLCFWKSWQLRRPSPKHEEQFQNWVRRKEVWLRPERAAEIVEQELTRPISISERIDGGKPRKMMERRLRLRLGYDRKRARLVAKAFALQNPGIEELYRYDPSYRYRD